MSCRRRQKDLQDFLSNDLPPRARRDLEAHLATCASCRKDLDGYSLLLGTLPGLPEPRVPVDLSDQIMAAVRARRMTHRPERETASAALVRRSVLVLFSAAFAVALGTALWGWAARITGFGSRMISRDLLTLWDATKDLWSLLTLLGDVVTYLQPTAENVWTVLLRAGEPLATLGLALLVAYATALTLGSFLCWRAVFRGGERSLHHVS